MAPRSRRPDAAGLGRRVWEYVQSRAGDAPEEFTSDTRDEFPGWLWEGPFAALIRQAIPGITDADLRRAREYLSASGMVVNVRAPQSDAPPQWFIRAEWHQGQGGHVHVVGPARPSQPPAPPAAKPEPGVRPQEPAHQPGQDIVAALGALAGQVAELQADNDRLRAENARLAADADRVRALARQAGGAIARQASQLLAGTED
jgi:hypothetical protein